LIIKDTQLSTKNQLKTMPALWITEVWSALWMCGNQIPLSKAACLEQLVYFTGK
jgi:hypothetical protein